MGAQRAKPGSAFAGRAGASSKFLQRPRPRRGSFPQPPAAGSGRKLDVAGRGGSALKMGSVAFKFVLKNVDSRSGVLQEGGSVKLAGKSGF